MAKPKTEGDRILDALENLRTRVEDLFILQASQAGINGHTVRAMLGIDMARVTRIAKHAKKRE